MTHNIKLSGAVAWGIMAKPPRVNASERPKGVDLSALLEAEPVPLVFLKTVEASIRLIVNTNKQNDRAVKVLISLKLAAIWTAKRIGAC